MGDPLLAADRENGPQTQATSRRRLAHGRDAHQGQGRLEIPYRAVDKHGKTVDFLLTTKRDMAAAKRFLDKAMGANGDPDKVAMDKSGADKAAINSINDGRAVPILVRQVKYLNNIVEQDYSAIKRVSRPMLNCKSFRSAGSVLAGIELMHMIRKANSQWMAPRPCQWQTNSLRSQK
jgi:transposase-like protein